DHRRGWAQLPRPRGSAAPSNLGRHDQRSERPTDNQPDRGDRAVRRAAAHCAVAQCRRATAQHPAGLGAGSGMTDSSVLQVEDLRTHLWSPGGVVRAVDGVSLSVGEGRTLGVVGESGSGKTVLGRSIMGLYESRAVALREGRVLLDGLDLTAL